MSKLLVDVDGILWEQTKPFNAYVLDKYGVEMPDDWVHYDTPFHVVDRECAIEAIGAVCSVADKPFFPFAGERLRNIRDAGVDMTFCTYTRPERHDGIVEWIAREYPPPFDVVIVDSPSAKLDVARERGAVGIIDDKPSTLAEFRAAGLFTATLDRTYNRDAVVDYRFDSWPRFSPARLVEYLAAREHTLRLRGALAW